MAKRDIPTITPKQSEQARLVKIARDRLRRVHIKIANEQLARAGVELAPGEKLTKEQRDRAVEAAESKPGLTGSALGAWILEGKDGKAQVAEAKAAERTRRAAARRGPGRGNRSKDEPAAELARAAAALAPRDAPNGVRSEFLPKEGRQFMDLFDQARDGPQSITITRKGAQGLEGALEEATVKRAELRRFAVDGERNREIRAVLQGLGKGTRLWGRKLGLMILATDRAQRS